MERLKYIMRRLGFGSKTHSSRMSPNEATLTIEINNKNPIELLDLTDSMHAVGKQYVRYLNKTGNTVSENTKLYVKEVRSGSVIIELSDLLPFSIPFVDITNWNSILEFVQHLKAVYEYLLGKGPKPEGDFQKADWQNYSSIVNPVVKDEGSQINISGDFIDKRKVTINLNFTETNAIQNRAAQEISLLKAPTTGEHKNAVFYWHTIKNAKSGTSGEKGIIESISVNPVKVVFDDETIKNGMAFMENKNPMLSGFIVDVYVESINEEPALYRIQRLKGEV